MPNMTETLIASGRSLIGKARYEFLAEPYQAPEVVSCQTFIWWLYAEYGIFIPHLVSEQVQLGVLVQVPKQRRCGDLVFSRGQGRYNFYDGERAKDGVGHVGMLTEKGTILHASSKAKTVVEESLERFLVKEGRFRGIYRILPYV